jgi:alpha-amylase
VSIQNGVLFQYFHWYYNEDGTLWRDVAKDAHILRENGITAIWLPPACKGAHGKTDSGYAIYDLYDLGEFDQKGSVRTRWGTKQELIDAVKAIQDAGMQVYADVVLNHRCGADATEIVEVVEVSDEDRSKDLPDSKHHAEVYTRFTYPARQGKYSQFVWTHEHFTTVDYKKEGNENGKLYRLANKQFADDVGLEHGNYDYLLGADVDLHHPDVDKELKEWGKWFVEQTNVDGFRFDAAKHMSASWMKDYVRYLREHFKERELLSIAEYATSNLDELKSYLHQTERTIKIFDFPLQHKFVEASKKGKEFDLTKLFENTLVTTDPEMAVTFVNSHDSQPREDDHSYVADWFQPLAYAITLLRKEGYPLVFHADYYGYQSPQHTHAGHRDLINVLLKARRAYNWGDQHDYFDHPNCVAWVRTGNTEHPGCMVVILSNGDDGRKRIQTPVKNAKFTDITDTCKDPIQTDNEGQAEFYCRGGKVSVWVQS